VSPRAVAILVPAVWMGVFVLAPVVILLAIAFGEPAEALPPFLPPLRRGAEGWEVAPNFGNLALLAEDPFYRDALLRSLRVATASAMLCLAIGYPMALSIARAPARWRAPLLLAAVLPFWSSFLLRITAWMGIFALDGPLPLLFTEAAVLVGMTYAYLPFAVLPLYANLSKHDPALVEAAADLGASPWRAFLRVTLPLSMPGAVAAFLLVFIPAMGEFVIPELLGGPGAQLLGRVVWAEFFQNRDWPLAATLAIVLLLILVVPIAALQSRAGR